MEWISIKDQLPDAHEKVLVQFGDGNVHIGIRDDRNKWSIYWRDGLSEQDYLRPITNWQPLPKPKKNA